MSDDDRNEMPFLDHLEELRRRLLKVGLACVAGAGISWFFVDYMIDILAAFVGQVYFMAPTEAFLIRLKLAIIMGIVLAVPVIFYQLWKFISPGLYESEKTTVIPVVIATTFFFLLGGSFCYFVVLPAALRFLMGYGTENMMPLISVANLLSFCAYMILAFGFVFELPIVAFFLGRIGLITHKTLRKGRRYALVLALVIGAILTPPDPFSQMLLAGPLVILYEASIWIVWATGKERKKDDSFEEDEGETGRSG